MSLLLLHSATDILSFAIITSKIISQALIYCKHKISLLLNRLWLDDTYSNYGGELYLKDWYNNPKILFDPVIFNALLRHFITGTAQNFDENVVDAVNRGLLFHL